MSFKTHTQGSLVFLTSPLLTGVRHGFSTRCGGVSPAPWDSLNLGPGRGTALRVSWKITAASARPSAQSRRVPY